MSIIRFVLLIALLALEAGCFAPRPQPTPDVLASFHRCFNQDPATLDKAIQDDYQDYINNLPQELRVGIGVIWYLEDGSGQHAVTFELGQNGIDWAYALIYDRNDKRIEVIKWVSGYYRS